MTKGTEYGSTAKSQKSSASGHGQVPSQEWHPQSQGAGPPRCPYAGHRQERQAALPARGHELAERENRQTEPADHAGGCGQAGQSLKKSASIRILTNSATSGFRDRKIVVKAEEM